MNRSANSFDKMTVWAQVDGDAAAVAELIELVAQELPQWIATLKTQAAAGDLAGVSRSAHKICGGIGVLDAVDVVSVARSIERHARSGAASPVTPLCDALEEAAGILIRDLHAWSKNLEGQLGLAAGRE